jgi:hypothetical protein
VLVVLAAVAAWAVARSSSRAPAADGDAEVRADGASPPLARPPASLEAAPRATPPDGPAASSAARWRGSGRVVDEDGRPVRGAVVTAAGTTSPSSTTDEAGAYDGTPSGADGYVPALIERVAAGRADVRAARARGLSIVGSVVAAAGDPVARPVSVRVVGRLPSGDADYTRRASVRVVDGVLRVPGLAPGAYDLWVVPEAAPADSAGARVSSTVVRDVAAGTTGLVVRLARGVVLAGRIEDGDGVPVTGPGYVYAYREGEAGKAHPVEGVVPGDGTFRVGPLDETRRYDLLAVAFPGRRESLTTRIEPGDDRIVLVLQPAGRIAGRVETEDGKPVPASVPVGLLAEGADVRGVGTRVFAYTKPDGTFEADGLAPFAFVVEAGGGRSGYLGDPRSGVATGTTDVVLRVSAGVTLAGTLVDAAGAPVATTSLQADDGARRAAMRPYAQVGLDGRFVLRGLRAGPVRLTLRAGEGWLEAGSVEAPASDVVVRVPAR